MKRDEVRRHYHNAPLHERARHLSVHLSKELREKFNMRSLRVRKGDKVKVVRGKHKGSSGVVSKVDYLKRKVYVEGLSTRTLRGVERLDPIHPSNLVIVELGETKGRKIEVK